MSIYRDIYKPLNSQPYYLITRWKRCLKQSCERPNGRSRLQQSSSCQFLSSQQKENVCFFCARAKETNIFFLLSCLVCFTIVRCKEDVALQRNIIFAAITLGLQRVVAQQQLVEDRLNIILFLSTKRKKVFIKEVDFQGQKRGVFGG